MEQDLSFNKQMNIVSTINRKIFLLVSYIAFHQDKLLICNLSVQIKCKSILRCQSLECRWRDSNMHNVFACVHLNPNILIHVTGYMGLSTSDPLMWGCNEKICCFMLFCSQLSPLVQKEHNICTKNSRSEVFILSQMLSLLKPSLCHSHDDIFTMY